MVHEEINWRIGRLVPFGSFFVLEDDDQQFVEEVSQQGTCRVGDGCDGSDVLRPPHEDLFVFSQFSTNPAATVAFGFPEANGFAKTA